MYSSYVTGQGLFCGRRVSVHTRITNNDPAAILFVGSKKSLPFDMHVGWSFVSDRILDGYTAIRVGRHLLLSPASYADLQVGTA
jgi:hypothetical protein